MQQAIPTSKQLTFDLGEDGLTCSAAASPASHSALLGSEKARQMTATSGRRCFAAFEKLPQATSWAKTLTESLLGAAVWYSKQCAMTWKMKATRSQRIAFQLVPRVRRTEGIDGGLLHTPSAQEPGVKTERLQTKDGQPAQIGQRAYDKHNGRLAQVGLSQQLQMLPTPKTQNANSPAIHGQGGMYLQTAIAMLPTLDAAMHKTGYMGSNRDGKQVNTETAVREATGGANTGLKLQPGFAAWMMGFPEDWTLLPFLASNNTPPVAGERNHSKPTETPSCPP